MAPETRLSAFKKNGSFSRDDFLRNADELLVKSEPGKETILEKTDNNRQSDKLLDIHASRVGFWSNTAEGMTGGTPFLFRGGQTRKAEVSEPGFFHNQNFTIEAWVKLEPGFNRDPMAIFSYGAEDLAFFLTPEGNLMLSRNNKISITGNNILVNDLDVHQVVVTKTGSKVIFYVDGRPSSPFEFGDTFIFKGNPAIGDRPDLGFQHHFPGSIYKVELYNRPLSEEEIQRSRENDELLYK
ncbi:MAG: hypothetical protein JWQ35_1405 [Bacteriovoracaceae bacterium]|nr:hypothetical protein [Bacteriovoracaceae bacterium]